MLGVKKGEEKEEEKRSVPVLRIHNRVRTGIFPMTLHVGFSIIHARSKEQVQSHQACNRCFVGPVIERGSGSRMRWLRGAANKGGVRRWMEGEKSCRLNLWRNGSQYTRGGPGVPWAGRLAEHEAPL
jgi:hypothetical protein